VFETENPKKDIRELLEGAAAATAASQSEPQTLQRTATPEEMAKTAMAAADADGDGTVSQTEFLEVWPGQREDGIERFKQLDTNSDGTISEDEMAQALAQMHAEK